MNENSELLDPSQVSGDLASSELRFRRLFEAARDGVLLIDPETHKIIEANPFMHVLLGYSPEDLLGKELFELGRQEDAPASRAAFAELLQKGYVRYENLPLETKSGEVREVEFVSNIYREGDKDIIQCNVRDISARKLAAKENAEKSRLLDLSNDAIIVRDLDDNIRLWSGGATRLYGWDSTEALGKHLHTLLQTEFLQPLSEVDAQLKRLGRYAGEVTQVTRDGRRVPSLCRWVLDKETGCVLATYTDITERKVAEAEIANARDKAVAAAQAKDDFLAALSHELRTPLSPVLLMASDAADDPSMPAEAREIFAMIERNVALEARLIDDLLDVTRITRAKMLLERKFTDVHLALRDAISTVQADVDEKRIELTLDLLPNSPWILGDAVRLQQIFWNVLRNAVKFTPVGGRIKVGTRLLSGARLEFKITDTGIGMTRAELNRIFVSFSQGDHAQNGGSRLFGGLGLGLSIARKLTELHGGTIRAESPGLNLGTTFLIELPLVPDAAHAKPTTIRADSRSPLPVGTPPSRILLVEDHEGTRNALTRLLVTRHHHVVSVGTAAEAQGAVKDGAFDVLVSDIGLPDGSGYDLMADFQKRFGMKGVALTGFGEAEDIARSQRAGFAAHVTKPASIQSLEHGLAIAAGVNGR